MYTPCHREPEAAWQPHGFRELLVANGRCAKGSLSARESRCGLSTHQRASACAAKPPAKKVHCRCNPRLGQLASHCLAQGAWCMAPAGPGGGGGGGVAGCAAALCAADPPTAAPPRSAVLPRGANPHRPAHRCPKRGLAPMLHSGSNTVAALPVGCRRQRGPLHGASQQIATRKLRGAAVRVATSPCPVPLRPARGPAGLRPDARAGPPWCLECWVHAIQIGVRGEQSQGSGAHELGAHF